MQVVSLQVLQSEVCVPNKAEYYMGPYSLKLIEMRAPESQIHC